MFRFRNKKRKAFLIVFLNCFPETNYHMARYHFIRSDDMQNLGSMLVEIQVDLGYPSEIDLFVTQAVMQILCLR